MRWNSRPAGSRLSGTVRLKVRKNGASGLGQKGPAGPRAGARPRPVSAEGGARFAKNREEATYPNPPLAPGGRGNLPLIQLDKESPKKLNSSCPPPPGRGLGGAASAGSGGRGARPPLFMGEDGLPPRASNGGDSFRLRGGPMRRPRLLRVAKGQDGRHTLPDGGPHRAGNAASAVGSMRHRLSTFNVVTALGTRGSATRRAANTNTRPRLPAVPS